MQELASSLKQFNDNIHAFKTFMEHPVINTGKWALNGVVASSYTFCLIGALGAVILYIFGFEKSGKYVLSFTLLYFLLQCIGMVL